MEQLSSHPKADINVGRQRAQGTNVNSIEKAIAKRRAAAKGSVATDEPNEVQVSTVIGKIKLIDPNSVTVGDRLRSDSESDPDLERSIKAMGQICPILVRESDMLLVSGSRRLRACKALGIKVAAHIADYDNVQLAEIEEDRCRLELSPYDKYRTTEALRPFFEDQAWQRRILGKKAAAAVKKGRADDMLADHVGISRTNLRKIREICQAHEEDPERFGDIFAALQRDRKVDRHHKALKRLLLSDDSEPKIESLVVHPDWQVVEAAKEGSALEEFLELSRIGMISDQAIVILPTSVENLPLAIMLLQRMKCKVKAAHEGSNDDPSIWLFGGGASSADLNSSAIRDAMAGGFSGLSEMFVTNSSNGHALRFDTGSAGTF